LKQDKKIRFVGEKLGKKGVFSDKQKPKGVGGRNKKGAPKITKEVAKRNRKVKTRKKKSARGW